MWYLAILMIPHLKPQDRNNGVLWAGPSVCGGQKHFCPIFGKVEDFYHQDWEWGSLMVVLMKMYPAPPPPPHTHTPGNK